ncbi:hypothetical protein D3C78_1275660 [compost metagenome]
MLFQPLIQVDFQRRVQTVIHGEQLVCLVRICAVYTAQGEPRVDRVWPIRVWIGTRGHRPERLKVDLDVYRTGAARFPTPQDLIAHLDNLGTQGALVILPPQHRWVDAEDHREILPFSNRSLFEWRRPPAHADLVGRLPVIVFQHMHLNALLGIQSIDQIIGSQWHLR